MNNKAPDIYFPDGKPYLLQRKGYQMEYDFNIGSYMVRYLDASGRYTREWDKYDAQGNLTAVKKLRPGSVAEGSIQYFNSQGIEQETKYFIIDHLAMHETIFFNQEKTEIWLSSYLSKDFSTSTCVEYYSSGRIKSIEQDFTLSDEFVCELYKDGDKDYRLLQTYKKGIPQKECVYDKQKLAKRILYNDFGKVRYIENVERKYDGSVHRRVYSGTGFAEEGDMICGIFKEYRFKELIANCPFVVADQGKVFLNGNMVEKNKGISVMNNNNRGTFIRCDVIEQNGLLVPKP